MPAAPLIKQKLRRTFGRAMVIATRQASAFRETLQAILSQLVTQGSLGHPETLPGQLSRTTCGRQRLQDVFALDFPQLVGFRALAGGCARRSEAAVAVARPLPSSRSDASRSPQMQASTSTMSPGPE
jgi:hypothetical protein